MPSCIECNSKKGTLRSKLEQFICKECARLDKYKLIVKTKAKQEYLLGDNDFENLHVYFGTAAYGGGLATYYIKEQLILRACQIYDTTPELLPDVLVDILEQKKIQKENKKMHRTLNKLSSCTTRTNKLVKALADAGLELRSDKCPV
jgi:hypothetical protein